MSSEVSSSKDKMRLDRICDFNNQPPQQLNIIEAQTVQEMVRQDMEGGDSLKKRKIQTLNAQESQECRKEQKSEVGLNEEEYVELVKSIDVQTAAIQDVSDKTKMLCDLYEKGGPAKNYIGHYLAFITLQQKNLEKHKEIVCYKGLHNFILEQERLQFDSMKNRLAHAYFLIGHIHKRNTFGLPDSKEKMKMFFQKGKALGDDRCYIGLGLHYEEEGQDDLAVDIWEEFLRLFGGKDFALEGSVHKHLGRLYQKKGNYILALDHFKQAISLGNPQAKLFYECCLELMTKNEEKEIPESLRIAVECKHPEAMLHLAKIYENGYGNVSKQPEKALELYWELFQKGRKELSFPIGKLCLEMQDFEKAIFYLKLSDMTDSEVRKALEKALFFQADKIMEKNKEHLENAVEPFREIVKDMENLMHQGSIDAALWLGDLYFFGNCFYKQNYRNAFACYRYVNETDSPKLLYKKSKSSLEFWKSLDPKDQRNRSDYLKDAAKWIDEAAQIDSSYERSPHRGEIHFYCYKIFGEVK